MIIDHVVLVSNKILFFFEVKITES